MKRNQDDKFLSRIGLKGPSPAASEPEPVSKPEPKADQSAAAEQGMIEAAWRKRQLPEQFRISRKSTDALFIMATPAQITDYHQRRRQNTERLVYLIENGADDQTVIKEANKFHIESAQLPRVAAPPATPEAEVSRCGPDLLSLPHRCPYRSTELEVLKQLLKPGERIEQFDIKSIRTDQRTIMRRDLPRATTPAHWTRFDKWDAGFPKPELYESDEPEYGRTPRDQMVTVVRE
jgi:hypothetical protein